MVETSQKVCAPDRYRSTWFQKNGCIVKIRWYYLSRIKSTGDRIYEKWGDPQYIHCNTIVRSFTRDVTLVQTGLKYSLSRDLDEHIRRFSEITV